MFLKKGISIGDDEGPLERSTIGIPLREVSLELEELEILKKLEEEVPPTTDTAYGTHHTCSAFQSESLTRGTRRVKMVNNGCTVDYGGPPM